MDPEPHAPSGPQKPLDEAITEYLMACEVESKSPRTVQAYGETLRVFRRIVERADLPGIVNAFTAAHVYRFLKAIADSDVSLGTRHRRFRETRAFFSWCTRMGYTLKHPFAGIPNVRLEQKVIQPFSEADIAALLAVCDPEIAFGCRNRAMILLFLDTGMRALELLRVELDDINWDLRRIHIRHGKGRKQRVVPFGEGPEQALRLYLNRFRGEEAGALFLAVRQPIRPLAPFALTTLFDRLGKRAGVEHTHAHRFRHTFATWAIENHAREIDVQYLLGHSTSAMVRRYAATYDSAKAADAHAAFSPAARFFAGADSAVAP